MDDRSSTELPRVTFWPRPGARDGPIEVEYLKHGGILPYVLRELMAA